MTKQTYCPDEDVAGGLPNKNRNTAYSDPLPPLLTVSHLALTLGGTALLSDVSFTVRRGETFALVGESGCGKSLTASAVMRLLPENACLSGQLLFDGQDLAALTEREMRDVRGRRIAFIFQEPSAALDPVMTAGDQVAEMILAHRRIPKAQAEAEAVAWLTKTGLPEPARTAHKFPHELSGGQKQRVVIAMALAAKPDLIIADEPTTALDVTVQAQILDLLDELKRTEGLTLLLITHDLAVVCQRADRLALLYAGQTVESAPCEDFFNAPAHPYAAALLAALPSAEKKTLTPVTGSVPPAGAMPPGCRFAPRCAFTDDACRESVPPLRDDGTRACRCRKAGAHPSPAGSVPAAVETPLPSMRPVLLDVHRLNVTYGKRGLFSRTKPFHAVHDLSFTLREGETLALVGESGSGKTTAAMAFLGLLGNGATVTGRAELAGRAVLPADRTACAFLRRNAQIIFQDPYASLDPRMTVAESLNEGLAALHPELSAAERLARVPGLLEAVGLPADAARRLPHAFSGGQRQRIAVARALALEPRLIVCDEPTSALDVSVQAQILNLLKKLQTERGLAYLFITHNFAVVEHMADTVAVMQAGRLVEQGPAAQVLTAPRETYTQRLLASVPRL